MYVEKHLMHAREGNNETSIMRTYTESFLVSPKGNPSSRPTAIASVVSPVRISGATLVVVLSSKKVR